MIVHAIMPEYNELIGVSYEVILMHIDLITIRSAKHRKAYT